MHTLVGRAEEALVPCLARGQYAEDSWRTWHIMWQGGRAMSGMAAGFQADRMMRLSLGLLRSLATTCPPQGQAWEG